MKKPSISHKNSQGFISLIGLLLLIAVVLVATSVYFYALKDDSAIVLNNNGTGSNASSTDGIGGTGGKDDTSDTARYAQKCGLTITFPTIGTTTSFPLPIKGVIDNTNYKALGCSWTSFEAQAGLVEVYANINNAGWKLVSHWGDNPNASQPGGVPLKTEGDWMSSSPTTVSALVLLDKSIGKIPAKTPMKIVIDEEDPSGKGGEKLEIPFVYSGENVEVMPLVIHKPILEHPTSCGGTYAVTRFVPKTTGVADASMRILLEENLPEIKQYYNGVTIKDGVATVDFDKPALSRLNSAACMQAMAKTPIEKTLKQFPTIKRVEYSIDGRLVTEWDA